MEDNKRNELLEGLMGSLTDEQKEKTKDCKDMKEFIVRLGETGVELPDELLGEVSGGIKIPDKPWCRICHGSLQRWTEVLYENRICSNCYYKYGDKVFDKSWIPGLWREGEEPTVDHW